MTISNWPETVNTRFFGYQKKPKENAIVSEFVSGRVSGYKKNSFLQFIHSCSLLLTKEETAEFWEWFEEMGTTTGAFTCTALGSGYFRFVSIPSPQDTDQMYTTLDMEIEDIY